ncbi:prepilin-type N-terminal cleavage/methylation domain-containing protein [Candidatus Sumerlaeota bacterium]|nr:prepilin-type N-terminal cleavage/methylation domain-containing protein [Candidatus Sumerlaeota bacterium]
MIPQAKNMRTGFTLVELLIVVAVIAILALIAIPNFLEAQTRAKVSRVRADLRSVATGLEAYANDNNDYPPNDGIYNVLPIQLTTPVAFLSSVHFVDPFSNREIHPIYGELARYYTYTRIVTLRELIALIHSGGPLPPIEGVDAPGFNEGAFKRYGKWRLVSNGPDRTYSKTGIPLGPFNPNNSLLGSDIPYDATNGTVSWGNILRTQRSTQGFTIF